MQRHQQPGALWRALEERCAAALESGALETIRARCEVVEDAGVAFQVRIAEPLAREHRDALASSARLAVEEANPFLPHDPELFVADLSETHLCLLNKFMLLDHHLLIVTRAFEEQESALTRQDFQALWACFDGIAPIDALGFYNAGPVAGASQRHKHLQVVPLPLGASERLGAGETPRLPIEPVLEATRLEGAVGRAPGLPFPHALGRLQALEKPNATDPRASSDVAECSLALYHELRGSLDQADDDGSTSYNLLITREWMLYVPRYREGCESIEVNALGFAGSFFVRSPGALERLKALGPMNLLRRVATPYNTPAAEGSV